MRETFELYRKSKCKNKKWAFVTCTESYESIRRQVEKRKLKPGDWKIVIYEDEPIYMNFSFLKEGKK